MVRSINTLRFLVASGALAVSAGVASAGDCGGGYFVPRQHYAPVYGYAQATQYHVPVAHCDHRPITFFSSQLGCRLKIEVVTLHDLGSFTCAKLISNPVPGSPLAELGLVRGDMITRLHGSRIHSEADLRCQTGDILCRYVKAADCLVLENTICLHEGIQYSEHGRSLAPVPEIAHQNNGALRP
jgi:hypothetical protein